MDESEVRERAQALCDALCAGEIDSAIAVFSDELRRNLGEVLALFPLPATEVEIESIERGRAGFNVVLRLVGDAEEVKVQTRWKDRDGTPTVVEASHLSRTITEAPSAEDEPSEVVEGGAARIEPQGSA